MKILCMVNVYEKLIMAPEIIFESGIFSNNRIFKSASCPYLEMKNLLEKARRKRKDGCFICLHGNC